MMAFIAHGHVPGKGQYGTRLERATDFVVSCQKPNGLVTKVGPEGPTINRQMSHEIGSCAAYNHAISSLVLSEVYGMSQSSRARRLETAIRKSLAATLEMQVWPKILRPTAAAGDTSTGSTKSTPTFRLRVGS